jgi:ring-1,2-phenylacetyl-CoA epoxidase subunit PaaD
MVTLATRPAVESSHPAPTEARVRSVLAEVADPEIPAISIVDLGIVHGVAVDGPTIRVELLPTFVGCPALELIRTAVTERLEDAFAGVTVDVVFTFAEPWTSDRITPAGHEALRRSGIGPPLIGSSLATQASIVPISVAVPCPFCGSRRTVLENAFGPTACRSIRYCTDCRQPFEQIKTI